jgi:hypothetical protein
LDFAFLKSQTLAQLHAFWLEYVGDRQQSEWMLAVLAATGLVVWGVSWYTQRVPHRIRK